MKLIGSTTSPYVRRIRILLGEEPHEFVNLDIFDKDREELRRQNPALRIPMLIDGDQVLYDSRIIARYISAKQNRDPLTWDQENQLTLIDAANDSAVLLLQSKRSGLDIDSDAMFFRLQHERMDSSLKALAEQVEEGRFRDWNYPAICLYCMVDWVDFRGLSDFAGVESLLEFRDSYREDPWVQRTDPRQG